MAWWQWSKTASTNATADSSINWAEGQSPSSVNNSARAMMAAAAGWRDDISGALTTTGTGSALVVASNQGFDTLAHMNNAMIAFIPNATNTGAVTLAVDGLTAKPIRSQTGSAGELQAGVLVLGSPYLVTYKNATNEFLLHGFYGSPYSVPLGSFLFHSIATPPNSSFIFPIAQAISRTTYAAYFAMVGTTFGVGDGATTFNVPDLRSRILLPMATMGGSDPSRVTTAGSGVDGATIGATGGAQNVVLDATMIPSHTHVFAGDALTGHAHTVPVSTQSETISVGGTGMTLPGGTTSTSSVSAGTPSGTNASTGGGLLHNNMPPVFVLPILLRIF